MILIPATKTMSIGCPIVSDKVQPRFLLRNYYDYYFHLVSVCVCRILSLELAYFGYNENVTTYIRQHNDADNDVVFAIFVYSYLCKNVQV